MKFKQKLLNLLIFSVILLSISLSNSCSNDQVNPSENWTNLKIAVFSDPHLFDPSLCYTGEALENYLKTDRKLLKESSFITESIVNSLLKEKPDFVVVCGDLTKDGELKSHQLFESKIKKLRENGIQVFVIPGNHDILNPESFSYYEASSTKVPNISAEDFSNLYKNYGFSNAISRDKTTLSYVVEPKPGLWLLAIDANLYKENKDIETVAGNISAETMVWIKERIAEAKQKNKMIIGTMHHGIIEHYSGQSVYFKDYLVNNYSDVADQLAKAGLRIMLTGHFHANDITKKIVGNDFIFDIETGSSISAPCAYRIMNLSKDGILDIKTKYVTEINYDLNGYRNFQTYAYMDLKNGLTPIVAYILKYQFKLNDDQIASSTPNLITGLMAHYAGDESPDQSTLDYISNLKNTPNMFNLGNLLSGFWTDFIPKDNNVIIDMNTGKVTE
jgi:predicted phosphodiesterase